MITAIDSFSMWTQETNLPTTYYAREAELVREAFYNCIYRDDYGINPCSKWFSVELDDVDLTIDADKIVTVRTEYA